jgi:tetratricopeptide (TPR) repeat protein
MANLQAEIEGRERLIGLRPQTTTLAQSELIELVALRGEILGRVKDYQWCADKAEQLTLDAPTDGAAFVARSRARARFHRFTDALADLDEAQCLGADPGMLDADRASIFQALGRYGRALTLYKEALARRGDYSAFGALATLHADRGEVEPAEQLFDRARAQYRGVSPIPVALLEFQRGHMWLARGDLSRARMWLESATRRLPDYATAQGHLAEIEAALGDIEAAIARLLPLTTSSDDPDYAASLARILKEAGREQAALEWRDRAEARYEGLVARYPEAFADHAAEFWLAGGADSERALELARSNLELRQTARARELFTRAWTRAVDGPGRSHTRVSERSV